jgi:nucleotide-binding universal stress UspA family protein
VTADEEFAEVEMQKVDSQLAGVAHETNVQWGSDVWTTVAQAIKDSHADLLVLGTHGRTGVQKLLLGSVAEEVFRRSPVPVLTIGPAVFGGGHSEGELHRVLFATDFGTETQRAARYAISFAQESQARLVLLHVIHNQKPSNGHSREASVAEVMHRLHGLVPTEAEIWCRPEAVMEYGDPAMTILRTAKDRGADLIVLGVHTSGRGVTQKTHLECAIAHKVVAHSPCPVLTARSEGRT